MEFTPEFEDLIRDIYNDLNASSSKRADEFLEAVEAVRQGLAADPLSGEFYCYDRSGGAINAIAVNGFDCSVLFRPPPVNILIWIEGYPS